MFINSTDTGLLYTYDISYLFAYRPYPGLRHAGPVPGDPDRLGLGDQGAVVDGQGIAAGRHGGAHTKVTYNTHFGTIYFPIV